MSKRLYKEFIEYGSPEEFNKCMNLGELKKAQRVLYNYFKDQKKVWSVFDFYNNRGK